MNNRTSHLELTVKIKPSIGGVDLFQNLLNEKSVFTMSSQTYISQNSFRFPFSTGSCSSKNPATSDAFQ